jgi:hypothetical protein
VDEIDPSVASGAGIEPVADGSPAAASARAGLARTGTAALAVLDRVVPIAARIVGVLNVYSWVVIGASVVILVITAAVTRPVTVGSVIPYLILVVALAIPGLSLRLFHSAMVEVLQMPDWLKTSPDLMRAHGGELAQLAGQAAVRSRERLTSLPRDIFRSGRILMKAHGELPDYGRMIRLINLPFLFVVLVSFLVGFMIVALAFFMIVSLPVVIALR